MGMAACSSARLATDSFPLPFQLENLSKCLIEWVGCPLNLDLLGLISVPPYQCNNHTLPHQNQQPNPVSTKEMAQGPDVLHALHEGALKTIPGTTAPIAPTWGCRGVGREKDSAPL